MCEVAAYLLILFPCEFAARVAFFGNVKRAPAPVLLTALSGWQGTDWHYLSAPRAVLAPIWKAYGVYVGPPTTAGEDPEHYAGLYLIDPRGRLRAYYDVPFLAPRVAAAIRALLPT